MYFYTLFDAAIQSKYSFKKTCRERLIELPRRLIKKNDLNNLPEKEKEAQMKDAEK